MLLLLVLGATVRSVPPPAAQGIAATMYHVDCDSGSDTTGRGTPALPFRSPHRAQRAIRQQRAAATTTAAAAAATTTVKVTGLCELPTPLAFGPADSNVQWVGDGPGAILSGGTLISGARTAARQPPGSVGTAAAPAAPSLQKVDLRQFNFTAETLGVYRGRGYAGGSACILLNNFEASPAELFYRPAGPSSTAGSRSSSEREVGVMRVARFPSVTGDVPSTSDWAKVTSVQNKTTLTISGTTSESLEGWGAALKEGKQLFAHGLWSWNWADAHRPVLAVNTLAKTITVGDDDYNHDVSPIKTGHRSAQGGNLYVYGASSDLDHAGEYIIDKAAVSVTFMPPLSEVGRPSAASVGGQYHISRLQSVVVAKGASGVRMSNLEIRYARGAGVIVEDSTNVVLDTVTVSNHGLMGVNITRGNSCGVINSNVAGNGDVGVALFGGDRQTLTPSRHFVNHSTVHHNQRWILNYAPDIFMGGVGQSSTGCEIYGSPQIGVFMQGNDHTLSKARIHDAARQCSDCGSFYMGREWTYRGNVIEQSHFSGLKSIWGSVSAIYLDDQLSSVRIDSCVFDHHTGMLLELGGGRHNSFVNNIINGSGGSIHFDARGGGGSACVKPDGMPYKFLARVPYNTSAAWKKYPGLADILQDQPCEPKHNRIAGNILCGGASSLGLKPETVLKWGSLMENNTVKPGAC